MADGEDQGLIQPVSHRDTNGEARNVVAETTTNNLGDTTTKDVVGEQKSNMCG